MMWLIDGPACVCVAAALTASVWLQWVRGSEDVRTMDALRVRISDNQRELALLQQQRTQQQTILAETQKAMAQGGRIPRTVPVEEYFGLLSRLAAEHQLKILRHHPLGTRTYPGLREQCFAYEVSGGFPDLVGFLRAMESLDAGSMWADVSYWRMEDGHGVRTAHGTGDDRAAILTVSIFSSLPPDNQPVGATP